jgi:hypothetical protein
LPEAHTFLTLLVVIDRFPFVIVAIVEVRGVD